MNKLIRYLLAPMVLFVLSSSALAAPVFVGSWQVDEGPNWWGPPVAYSGQQAAALIFGGSPIDYLISTSGTDLNLITNTAWVSVWGGVGGDFPSGLEVAQGLVISATGFYEAEGDTSAYVNDWAVGPTFVNYAFRDTSPSAVPEIDASSATIPLAMIVMVGCLLGDARKRKIADERPA